MSHYTVGVICKSVHDIDNILAPYWEGLEVAPYINRTKAEMIKEAKETKEKYASDTDLEVEQHSWVLPWLNAETDEDFYNVEKDESVYDYDVDGNEMTTYNPDSKWDWYSIGGRWNNMLKLKEPNEVGEEYCNYAKIKDIDFSLNIEEYEAQYNWWKTYVETPNSEWNDFFTKEYYTERYSGAEDYARRNSKFSTFAIVTSDGEWHEKGLMGWFGCSSDTPDEAREWDDRYMSYIRNADPVIQPSIFAVPYTCRIVIFVSI